MGKKLWEKKSKKKEKGEKEWARGEDGEGKEGREGKVQCQARVSSLTKWHITIILQHFNTTGTSWLRHFNNALNLVFTCRGSGKSRVAAILNSRFQNTTRTALKMLGQRAPSPPRLGAPLPCFLQGNELRTSNDRCNLGLGARRPIPARQTHTVPGSLP